MTPRQVAEMVRLVDSIYNTLDDGYDLPKHGTVEECGAKLEKIAHDKMDTRSLYEAVRELRDMLAE